MTTFYITLAFVSLISGLIMLFYHFRLWKFQREYNIPYYHEENIVDRSVGFLFTFGAILTGNGITLMYGVFSDTININHNNYIPLAIFFVVIFGSISYYLLVRSLIFIHKNK